MTSDAFVFIGGGSGGHVFPGLAVAESIRQLHPLADVVFFCSDRPVDRQILEHAALQIPSMRWECCEHFARGGRLRRLLLGAWRLFANYRRLRRRLREIEPVAVVGLGAAASVAGCIAASNLKIPVILLESNTVPGRATTALSSRAMMTFTGLPLLQSYLGEIHCDLESVGVPVRRVLADLLERPAGGSATAPRLLILGGSQGASRLNKLVTCVLEQGHQLPEHWEIVHQTGIGDVQVVRDFYEGRPWRVRVEPFLKAMDEELAAATLVISRAGAGALAELACARSAAILLPLMPSADQHQWHNADYYVSAGAARVVDEQSEDAVAVLTGALTELVQSPEKRASLSAAMGTVARPQAARRVAEFLVDLAGGCLKKMPAAGSSAGEGCP
jgi:UDP-N-acetylglucosamine--N-acetylmuramyl-(pentapeptide) pyrophosphoryl-undecaprenol N-acetylglucosamine transferase